MPARACQQGFLKAYLDYTELQESPELFHLWSCFSIISMALGRKCLIGRGHFTCYPNQYIILVGDSAFSRKTVASGIAVRLYRDSNIGDVFQGRVTERALSQYLWEKTQTIGSASAFLYSPELGRLLGSETYNTGLMTAFTDYYDCPETDVYRTASRGIDEPKNFFINILGCTVPEWLSKMPGEMVEGGFSSRTMFIVQSGRGIPNPRPQKTLKELELYDRLKQDLVLIAELAGEFSWTERAGIYYDTWYYNNFNSTEERDPRLRAYFARKGEHVLKLAMGLCAAQSSSMLLTETHISQALAFLKQAEVMMPTAFRGISFSESTRHMDRIMGQIKEKGGIERSALLRMNRLYLGKEELDRVLETLTEANLVRLEIKSNGKRWYYCT